MESARGSSCDYGMIEMAASVGEARLDVLSFQIRHLVKHLLLRQPGGEQVENVDDADTHPPDARTPAALLGVNCDAVEKLAHLRHSWNLGKQPNTLLTCATLRLSASAARAQPESCRLTPEDLHVVGLEPGVVGDQRQLLGGGLSDQHAIERVSVMLG